MGPYHLFGSWDLFGTNPAKGVSETIHCPTVPSWSLPGWSWARRPSRHCRGCSRSSSRAASILSARQWFPWNLRGMHIAKCLNQRFEPTLEINDYLVICIWKQSMNRNSMEGVCSDQDKKAHQSDIHGLDGTGIFADVICAQIENLLTYLW